MKNFQAERKLARDKAAYNQTTPTVTDQSQAAETDINVIVRRYGVAGQAPGGPEPIYADFTDLPRDLREFFDTARSIDQHRERLPEKLRNIPLEELIALTPDAITNILTPPAEPPANEEVQK